MTLHDDDHSNSAADSTRLIRRILVGAAGLAVVLGGGAYVITSQILDHNDKTAQQEPAALAPMTGSSTSAATPPASSPAADRPSSSVVSPSATAASTPASEVDEEIKAAREKAAKDGFPLRRAKTPGPHIESGPVDERTEPRKDGVLRIVTAKFDLTGQRELLWPANGGQPVGDAECTQTFRFANEGKASTKPNLLLCWRTSAKKSVVTVLVDRTGKPSTAESLKVIDTEWAKLG